MTGDPPAMIIMAGYPTQVTPVPRGPFAVTIVVALNPYFTAPASGRVGVAEIECHEKSKAQTRNKILHHSSSGLVWVSWMWVELHPCPCNRYECDEVLSKIRTAEGEEEKDEREPNTPAACICSWRSIIPEG